MMSVALTLDCVTWQIHGCHTIPKNNDNNNNNN